VSDESASRGAAHAVTPRAVIPRATYRLQLNAGFTLRHATELVPYLAALGVSHVYCSPYFRARAGSVHGYDVVDHNSINPEIGTREDLEEFVRTLRAHSMGHILDIVPNHVGIMGADNAWWMDVLENGPASAYAQFFDIDWQSVDPALAGKVLVPVLGDSYGAVLERGELELRFEYPSGSLAIFYHEHRFPLDPRTYPMVLERALELDPAKSLSEEERAEFSSLSAAFGHLPDRHELSDAKLAERQRDKDVHKRRLARLCTRNAALIEAIHAAVQTLAGSPGDASSFDTLHELLDAQAYRLAYWRVASDEINYRRFFDVNDLAALRMENETVFEATHALVLELLAQGKLDGLRIDHPDGLYDPAQYFRRLQSRVGALEGSRAELPLYLVVEKITAGFERLPEDWPVHGTTGYHFVNVVNGLCVDGSARARMSRIYRTFIGEHLDWVDVAYQAKRFIVGTSLAAELNVLASQLARIARATRSTRDFTLNSLRHALAELIACFPVYRTYIADSVSNEDRRYIDWALTSARRRAPSIDTAVFDFVRQVLLGEGPAAEGPAAAPARAFTMKLQQVTAPATAKGIEDTAFYRFNRLASLNEVGGEPDTFGVSVRAFHADAQQRARRWPHELLATSTHDTKRSEDVRARIDVLSEMPGEWRRILERWSRMNRSRKREVDGLAAPGPNDEYLLYQTLLGSLPLEDMDGEALQDYTKRIEAYMTKAVREAKLRSSWANVNVAYEDAVKQFVQAILESRPGNVFLADLSASAKQLAYFGLLNSLSQALCKHVAPGVPDTYQGTEVWDFSLVDPDNRRPVDYALRSRLLEEIQALRGAATPAAARELLTHLNDGRAKLYVIWRALELRGSEEALFARGDYLPLKVVGARAAHLCAFARRHEGRVIIALVPRLYWRLLAERGREPLGAAVWSDTEVEMPTGCQATHFDGALVAGRVRVQERGERRVLAVAEALASFPVALLTYTEAQP
jgi:(1->4)-alpha-D-glucan 1-alpha-D-glucosylmutase